MDDTLQDLENELKRLPLRPPSAGLWQELQRELGPAVTVEPVRRYRTATNLPSWKWLGWRTAGVAAALVLVAVLSLVNFNRSVMDEQSGAIHPARLAVASPAEPTRPVNLTRANRYQPVRASNVLYDLKDEGPVNVDGDAPARRLRYRYVDTYTWKNPRGNASLKWSVPRDEIRVLPVSMN